MATNFYGPVTIGTKVDVEQGGTYIRTKVEAGGVYNEYSNGEEVVEKAQDKGEQKNVTPEEARRLEDIAAIRVVMAMMNEDKFVFKLATQWQAVYRIFVDYRGWTTEYRGFTTQINELDEWRVPCTEDAVQSIGESYFHKPYKDWNENESGLKSGVYHRVADIAKKLVEFLNIDVNKPTK